VSKETHVYFIRPVALSGPVKIGYSTLPAARLRALMVWSPLPLEIVAQTPGDGKLERRFHTLFAKHHSHSEWFRPAPEIDLAIEQINAGTFDFAQLPKKGKLLDELARGPWSEAQREWLSLGSLLRLRCERHGIKTPDELLIKLAGFTKATADERRAISAEIHAHIADPMARGVLYKYAWAAESYAAYIAKREAA